MSTLKASPKEMLDLSLLNANDHHLADQMKRVENNLNKLFDKLDVKNERTASRIEVLTYFLIADILFCFLILGTMRAWF